MLKQSFDDEQYIKVKSILVVVKQPRCVVSVLIDISSVRVVLFLSLCILWGASHKPQK